MNKKAQTTKIFVYLLSIIMILFVGFLVVQFIAAFLGDAELAQENKIFNQLREDYNTVYRSFGSEKVYTYKVSSRVREICFVEVPTCVNSLTLSQQKRDELSLLVEGGDNVVVFDEETHLSSQVVEDFNIKGGCFCVEPSQGFFDLVFENRNNEVFIEEE